MQLIRNNLMIRTAKCLLIISTLMQFVACSKNDDNNEQELLIIEESLPVTDYDGNSYKTIRIGNQIWMAENLKVTHYADGTPVQSLVYNNDNTNQDVYGRLYTWSAFMRNEAGTNANPGNVQGVAPEGWHIPSDSEWLELINNLGGVNSAGGKLKQSGFLHWEEPNTGATDEIGFTALPSGWYDFTGIFGGLGTVCFFAT